MWTQTTTIHPSAWSDAVELDLARSLGLTAPLLDADGRVIGEQITDDHFKAAAASARQQLTKVSAPQTVTLVSDGTAWVVPIEGLVDEHAANETWHEERAALVAAEVEVIAAHMAAQV